MNDPIAAGPHLRSYQDGMIQLALDRHFETERENFRRGTKIKTLALFSSPTSVRTAMRTGIFGNGSSAICRTT